MIAYLLDRALAPQRRVSPAPPAAGRVASIGSLEFAAGRAEIWSSAPWRDWSATLILRRLSEGVAVDRLAYDLELAPEILRAALRDLGKRSNVPQRPAEILGRLADGKTLAQAAGELGLTEREAAAELEPSDALARGLCATVLANASLPISSAGPRPTAGQGPLRTMPVRFPEQQYRRLKEWCQAHGFPMAVVVRGVVERFLDEQQRRAT